MASSVRDELEAKLQRFEELERLMNDPEVLADPARLGPIVREHGSLAKIATRYRRLKELNAQIAEAEALARGDDPELKELAQAELPTLRAEREACWEDLLEMTTGGEDAHRTRCVLEIRAGTGGEEAALFARDLYNMYRRYAESRGWKWEVMDAHPSDLGGFKEVIVGIEGEGAFRRLQYESGVHRVQRVPETEAHGRIHTSAATVAVLPEPEDIEIELKPEDYREDVFHAGGPGGQHVNKTASAVRLTHLATGIVVTIQDERSQHKNRAKALRVLKARLYELRRREEEQKRAQERRSKIGTGDRSERIRTYNFPENRVTDHRIGLTLYQLDQILEGDLDPVIDALLDREKEEQRQAFGLASRS
ncbi:MAG: peptide chain release factor 1 [Thermoguttaceae bacterium]|nr:peptide chain release factor 1 [Thermoguttaceae bacterium]MDW8080095.1 peptide chain release factor 1 [Thermoguttaceae bacterium]